MCRKNSDVYCTPANAKPVLQAKSTIKRTGYLASSHPSHLKPSTMQSSHGHQSNEKSLVRAMQFKIQAPLSNVYKHEADLKNPETKSYKDKTLDMRYVGLWNCNKVHTERCVYKLMSCEFSSPTPLVR